MSDINERTRKSLEGTLNVMLDKAAEAEVAEVSLDYIKAADSLVQDMCKLQDADNREAETEIKQDQMSLEVAEKDRFWEREYSITPRQVLDGIFGVLKSAASGVAAFGGAYLMYKGVKSSNETTLKCMDAATNYQQSEVLQTKSLEMVDKANKLGK